MNEQAPRCAWPVHTIFHLAHNEHRASYQSVREAMASGLYEREDFPDEAEVARCIAEDSVWTLQWYPETPVGFHRVCAATFGRVLELAKAMEAENLKETLR